jgi:glyoxylase-like metal-dependent hydrolase (beta-lactamase superfamily II)
MEITRVTVTDLKSNCYIVKANDEIAVIDPGGDVEKILQKLDQIGGTVKCIIATHYHYDHTGAVKPLVEHFHVPFLIHESDVPFLDNLTADLALAEGDDVSIGDEALQVLHTPGHSSGSICLLGDGFIFTGDTLFQFSYGRTDFPGGDEDQMQSSLRRLHEILSPGMIVYPGHGLPFTVKA